MSVDRHIDSTTRQRSAAVRAGMLLGKKVLRSALQMQGALSNVPVTPILDANAFAWTGPLERHWRVIRAEMQDVLQHPDEIPAFHQLSPDQHRISKGNAWKTFGFYVFGQRVHGNALRCPRTAALLDSLPGLQNAWFSILAPGCHIPLHRGPTRAVLRCHLGLQIPRDKNACWMEVNGQVCHWQEGRVLVFDDSFPHEVRNDSQEVRVVLFLDFVRPSMLAGRIVNSLLLFLLRRSAYVRDPLRNLRNWQRQRLQQAPEQAAA